MYHSLVLKTACGLFKGIGEDSCPDADEKCQQRLSALQSIGNLILFRICLDIWSLMYTSNV